jgi:hypothetical protein
MTPAVTDALSDGHTQSYPTRRQRRVLGEGGKIGLMPMIMCRRFSVLAVLAAVTAANPGRAQSAADAVLDPDSFQSFVANWAPDTEPRCAAMRSQADWDKVMRPAPVRRGTKPFAPPADFWTRNGVVLIARVVDSGDMTRIFRLTGVRAAAGAIEIDYTFSPPPPASSKVKWWLGIKVAKPLAAVVRFVEKGRVACTAR